MGKILSFCKNYYLACTFILLTIISIVYLSFSNNRSVSAHELNDDIQKECICDCNKDNDIEVLVDIKGAVKNPGVYKLNSNSIVNDVIEAAGGLLKNASTNDINLSKAIYNEMVIYVSTKDEIKNKQNATNNVIPSSSSNNANIDNGGVSNNCINNLKVNINTASLEDLMTLNGIGEAKALKILEYRNTNGLFKVIEDIKNVSGIGDAFYDKIKDYITI